MSSALVKMMGNMGLFKLTSITKTKVSVHVHDKMCVLVGAGEVINLKDNTPITDSVIGPNQTVLIRPEVELIPTKYHALVSFNPELSLAGALVSPLSIVVRPNQEKGIGLVVRVNKKVDLNDFPHIFELYQID